MRPERSSIVIIERWRHRRPCEAWPRYGELRHPKPAPPDPAQIAADLDLLAQQCTVADHLVARLQTINSGPLRTPTISMAIKTFEDGRLWIDRAVRELTR